jgi:meso-butanediol dehydrogenase / (S,S)-butanediol dehydrogenase / diacetyl reductase
MRLAGRRAIVTGAGAGIGRASAERLMAEGAQVLAVDINADSLAWIRDMPNGAAMTGSVASLEVNREMVARVTRDWGPLSILHLNAGTVRMGMIGEDESALSDSFAVNMQGIASGITAAVPSMIEAGGGSIIVTSSTCGLFGDANVMAYAATKHGALGIVKSAAADLALKHIRVNAICPGPISTELAAGVREADPALDKRFRQRVPMQRWGEPAEVAAVVAFLASDDASYVTGAVIPVDGGLSATSALFPMPGE